MKHCSQCNAEFPEHFQFCGSCGRALTNSLTSDRDSTIPEASLTPSTRPQIVTSAPREKATRPASEATSAPKLTILSTYSEPEAPSKFRWPHGLMVGFLLVLFVSLLGIGGWYLWRRPVTQTSQSNTSTPDGMIENPSTAPSDQPTPTITPQQAPIASADEEIQQLRERRIGAEPSERVEIISALEQAENKYPNDYRFPYELSKLSIKGSISHHEAFEPLARAAQKAIDNGQADEMLNSFMADKDGAFHKLSHGHHEWEAIEQALRNKDKGVLKVSAH